MHARMDACMQTCMCRLRCLAGPARPQVDPLAGVLPELEHSVYGKRTAGLTRAALQQAMATSAFPAAGLLINVYFHGESSAQRLGAWGPQRHACMLAWPARRHPRSVGAGRLLANGVLGV